MTTWFSAWLTELPYMAHVGQNEGHNGSHKFCKNALSHVHLTLLDKRSKGDVIVMEVDQFHGYGRRATILASGERTPRSEEVLRVE